MSVRSGEEPPYTTACVTGRFQPPHLDHLELFRIALERHERLIVGVTNPDPSARRFHRDGPTRHEAASNPFTFAERLELLTAALVEEGVGPARFRVVPFALHDKDIVGHYVAHDVVHYVRVFSRWEASKVDLLREHGYRVIALPGNKENRISATTIRDAMRRGDGWHDQVPNAVASLAEAYLEAVPIGVRSA